MRIVISTFGSFGDLHPYVAIALELKRRGHRPVIATSEAYREKTDAVGLELHPVRPVLPSWEDTDAVSRMVTDFMDERKGTERILRFLSGSLRDSYEDLLAATSGADLLFTHPLPLANPVVAAKTGLPWVSSVLSPISLFSAYDPPVPPQMPSLYRLLKLHPAFVRALVPIGNLQLRPITEPVHRLRASLGLPRGGNPVFDAQHSPALVLALFSRVLASPQPDWPRNTHVTGFAFYDRRDRSGDAREADPALLRFLDAGPPPVVFTLGSSAIWAAGDFYAESIRAARALGLRALLLIGDERNRPPGTLPEGVAAFDYAPYSELLPRAAAVVHHGGVGTTGQALAAGVPSLIVPFSHDQFDNAARVERRGAGRTLPRKRYNAAAAERELRPLVNDPAYAARAADIGRLVRSEDGTQTACDLIESLFEGRGR
ncbi:MAG TPA: nucleotide disphospho-sugar-binding domain-containing protein [Pyrinomonadaceae bacterium]|nr:nucleotide disphospho-sugar-binding domain-containing protein [Pyrinomonadaceae bacterium]